MPLEETLIAVTLGLTLAVTCGLRAFLPLGLVSALGAGGLLDLPEQLGWMSSGPAVLTFWTAAVAEVIADKVPVVDNAFDAVATFLRPAAGAVAGGAMMAGADPMVACVFGLAGGTLVAGATHLGKASVRAGSTATTVGTGNPVLSVIEDVVVVGAGGAAVLGASALL